MFSQLTGYLRFLMKETLLMRKYHQLKIHRSSSLRLELAARVMLENKKGKSAKIEPTMVMQLKTRLHLELQQFFMIITKALLGKLRIPIRLSQADSIIEPIKSLLMINNLWGSQIQPEMLITKDICLDLLKLSKGEVPIACFLKAIHNLRDLQV